ncbi:hypothetical protein [Virgisporangium aurantiacum]|nr:hypothetical protein [Virgisporangium aurantiacum]
MADVYGDDWRVDVLNLARYVAKHIGCRMAHEGYPVPPSIPTFLNGGGRLNDVEMVLFKSRPHYELYRMGMRDGIDSRGLWISPANGAVSRSRQQLSMYSSSLIVNFVGVMYRWEHAKEDVDPFYVYQRGRLHLRHRLPEV